MSQFHFTPDEYLELMHAEVPSYDELQDRLAAATQGVSAERILDLGTGTGETARRVLERHPSATLMGLDASGEMLEAARAALPFDRVDLRVQRLEDPLPEGPFDLVISALAVHHLDGPGKANLFTRIAAVVREGGHFVMGDVIVPDDPSDAITPLSPGYDLPSPVPDLERWLTEAGFDVDVTWKEKDLAVFRCDLRDAAAGG